MSEEQSKWDETINSCYECGKKPTTKLLRCSKCRCPMYCSSACQKKGWKRVHKTECSIITKQKEQGKWSITLGQVARISDKHPLWQTPNPAGVALVKKLISDGITARGIAEQGNLVLAWWMNTEVGLSHPNLSRISRSLMDRCDDDHPDAEKIDKHKMMLLRCVLLIGCSSTGQPTVEEILKFMAAQQNKATEWNGLDDCCFNRIEQDRKGKPATFLFRKSQIKVNCPVTALAAYLKLKMDYHENKIDVKEGGNAAEGGSAVECGNADETFTFSEPDSPTVSLDATAVERELRDFILEHLQITLSTTDINSVMHATSMLVLSGSGIPFDYHYSRSFPELEWD